MAAVDDEVILPLASMVITGIPRVDPYVPAVTAVLASVNVPLAATVASPPRAERLNPVPLPINKEPTGAVVVLSPVPPLATPSIPLMLLVFAMSIADAVSTWVPALRER